MVVIAGWLGSKERQLKPYVNFYNKQGVDAITFSVGPQHVLKPHLATEQMQRILDALQRGTTVGIDKNGHKSVVDTVSFHHFSVGGYLYAQMLKIMEADRSTYQGLMDKIGAQVFDSPPDVIGISAGISRR